MKDDGSWTMAATWLKWLVIAVGVGLLIGALLSAAAKMLWKG